MAGFIKFDGVDGDSTDKNHKKWSFIDSFNQVISVPMSGTGSRARRGDTVFHDVQVVKHVDAASPKLAQYTASGMVFAKVQIEVTGSQTDKGRETYFAYELKNVRISSYNVGGATTDQTTTVPSETLMLNFEEIKNTYTGATPDGKPGGKVEYTWKVQEGQK